jgi:TRAP-type C4-dicarboxylate transport system substrate-binding protein
MTKDGKSTFPGSIRDYQEAVKAEAEEASAKIDEAFGKLSKKMRERAEKAKAKMEATRKPEKRAILLRRFELYADAASHLENRLPQRDD